MNSVLALYLLVHSHCCFDQQSAVRNAAELVVADLGVETKALIIETPADWIYLVFDEHLGRGIRNSFGLHGGLGRDEDLWEHCELAFPDVHADQFAHQCSAMVLEEIAQVLRDSADQSLISSLDSQLEALKGTPLPEFNYFGEKDYELTEVVTRLNEILEASGNRVDIQIDPEVLNRNIEIGGGHFWKPILRKRPEFEADSVLDILSRIKFELSTCLRRSPDVVWIGDDCSSFDGTSYLFSEDA